MKKRKRCDSQCRASVVQHADPEALSTPRSKAVDNQSASGEVCTERRLPFVPESGRKYESLPLGAHNLPVVLGLIREVLRDVH